MNNVFALRKEKNWSTEKLARSADCSNNTIINVEKGNNYPRIDLAWRISKALGKSIEAVFPFEGE